MSSASSIVFVSFLLATGAALWETGGLPFGALRRAMPAVQPSVHPGRWLRALHSHTDVTELPASQLYFWSSLSSGSAVEPPPLTRGERLVRRPLRCAQSRVGRRGAAGSLPRTRGPRVRRSHYFVLTHNQKSRAAVTPSSGRSRVGVVASTASARDRRPRAAGQRVLRPRLGRLLARWTTTSLGPPNCHTEQWSLPPAHVHGHKPPAKSGLPLGRTRIP